jgi:hypothetical protein
MMTDRKRDFPASEDEYLNASPKRSKTKNTPDNYNLIKVLKDLDAPSLGNILVQLLRKHSWLGNEVYPLIPLTIATVMNILDGKLKLLFKNLPLGSSTNDYSYNRVKGYYQEVLDSVAFYAEYFVNLPESIEWIDTTAAYLLLASDILQNKLMRWDNLEHEEPKFACFTRLQNGWSKMLRIVIYKVNQGKIFSQVNIGKWGECLWAGREVGDGKTIFRYKVY